MNLLQLTVKFIRFHCKYNSILRKTVWSGLDRRKCWDLVRIKSWAPYRPAGINLKLVGSNLTLATPIKHWFGLLDFQLKKTGSHIFSRFCSYFKCMLLKKNIKIQIHKKPNNNEMYLVNIYWLRYHPHSSHKQTLNKTMYL